MRASPAATDMERIRRQGRPDAWRLTPAVSKFHRPRLHWLSICMTLLFCCCSITTAVVPPQSAWSQPPATVAAAADATPVETLVADSRVPPVLEGQWNTVPLDNEDPELRMRDLQARADSDASATSSTAQSSPLPSLLVESLSSNFTSSDKYGNGPCVNFLKTLVANSTFQQCYPFSVLLLGSTAFFDAQKSLVSITKVLDATCAADSSTCSSYLSSVADALLGQDACGSDFDAGNTVVLQLNFALESYETLYAAACLRDRATSAYCFANAVTNVTNPSNTYFYYLPLNSSLPATVLPICNWCIKDTMAIYQAQSADRDLPIADTYQEAAADVNSFCGASFVNETLPAAVASSALPAVALAGAVPWFLVSTTFALVVQWLL